MYKKCENCYKDGKVPNEESCKKCEDDLKRKEQECKALRKDIKDIANLLDLDTGEEYNFGNIELEIKQLKVKEQEYEELRQYHNKCCEEFEKEKKEWLEKYNQVSRDFYNGKYCDKENCNLLKAKEQECERLKKKLNPKLKNAHCTYFEGQTGLCKAKEFTKCNPVNCKLYTIDELSTIVDLQQQLDQLKEFQKLLEEQMKFNKSELELSLSSEIKRSEFLIKEFKKVDKQRDNWREQAEKYSQTLAEINEIAEENDELLQGYHKEWANNKLILQKISEVVE